MSIVLVTGSTGLIGSNAVAHFCEMVTPSYESACLTRRPRPSPAVRPRYHRSQEFDQPFQPEYPATER